MYFFSSPLHLHASEIEAKLKMFTLSFTDTRCFFCRRYLFLIKNKGKFPLFFFSNHIAYANFNAPILSAQETRERALKANMINSESKKIWYVAYFSEEEKKKSNENLKSILKFETNIRIQISLEKNFNFFLVRNNFLKSFK